MQQPSPSREQHMRQSNLDRCAAINHIYTQCKACIQYLWNHQDKHYIGVNCKYATHHCIRSMLFQWRREPYVAHCQFYYFAFQHFVSVINFAQTRKLWTTLVFKQSAQRKLRLAFWPTVDMWLAFLERRDHVIIRNETSAGEYIAFCNRRNISIRHSM